MTRGIFVAGAESALFNAITAEAAKRVEYFAAALIPDRQKGPLEESKPPPRLTKSGSRPSSRDGEVQARLAEPAGTASLQGRSSAEIPLSWNPGSPISARTMILAAQNRLERIDEAILVCAPPAVNSAAADLNPADIESLVNDHIKGWFFLIKELARVFRAQKTGTLALAVPEVPVSGSRDSLPDLLGSSVIASFRTLTQGLIGSSFDEPYQVMGFSTSGPGEDAPFAAFIFKTIEEIGKKNAGKWHKFGKLNLFNR